MFCNYATLASGRLVINTSNYLEPKIRLSLAILGELYSRYDNRWVVC